jgi:hypothetical protein
MCATVWRSGGRCVAVMLRPARRCSCNSTGNQLFTPEGMRTAHTCLTARYRQAGAPDAYVGEFYDGRHRFDRAMQRSVFAHLELWLRE